VPFSPIHTEGAESLLLDRIAETSFILFFPTSHYKRTPLLVLVAMATLLCHDFAKPEALEARSSPERTEKKCFPQKKMRVLKKLTF